MKKYTFSGSVEDLRHRDLAVGERRYFLCSGVLYRDRLRAIAKGSLLGQAAHDRLCLRVIRTQRDGDAVRGQLVPVELDDFRRYGVKRLDDARALRVRGETLGERGNWRGGRR